MRSVCCENSSSAEKERRQGMKQYEMCLTGLLRKKLGFLVALSVFTR